MNTNSCNINLQTRIDAHKFLVQSIISILSIRSLCIDSLTVSAICSSKMCMNKYICTVHIYIIYNSSYLIICHISIYLCITALVYLCSCRINMHIYIHLLHISQTFSNGVSTRPWAIWCVDFCLPCPWHHPHCSTYSGFFFAAPWLCRGDKSAAIPKNDQKPLGKSKETQKRQWTKTCLTWCASATLDFNILRAAMIGCCGFKTAATNTKPKTCKCQASRSDIFAKKRRLLTSPWGCLRSTKMGGRHIAFLF